MLSLKESNNDDAIRGFNFSSLRSEDPTRKDFVSSKPQAQMLLTALRNVIIPLINAAAPNQNDVKEIPIGSEAEDFLAALQNYIACIIRNQCGAESQDRETQMAKLDELDDISPKATLTVNTTNVEVEKLDQDMKVHEDVKECSSDTMISEPAHLTAEKSIITKSLPYSDTQPQDETLSEAMSFLRSQIFNQMPIRLLCFEKQGSDFSINLLDRNGIYSHLESKLKEKFNSSSFEMASFAEIAIEWIPDMTTYAILSHTWLRSAPGELTYDDWNKGAYDLTHPGYQKLVEFCRVASVEHGFSLGWMDTLCINKESSAELDESIRSMYKWYLKAGICITYLAETTTLSDIANDPWFTRGWTLQELLAPTIIKFYGANWTQLSKDSVNDKEDHDVQEQITFATSIKPDELCLKCHIPISRKMIWAALRKVTREEDTSYSLMGIFNVNMSIAYGEGAGQAFTRLIKEILSTTKSDVLDIFNWAGDRHTDNSLLLPNCPQCYLFRSTLDFPPTRTKLIEPLTLTHLGLRVPVLLLPAAPANRSTRPYTPIGDYYGTCYFQRSFNHPSGYIMPRSYNLLDVESVRTNMSNFGARWIVFAVLNCSGDDLNILIPKRCIAVTLLHNEDVGMVTPLGIREKISTDDPIVFKLKNRTPQNPSKSTYDYETIERNQLERHGIQFLNMYL